MAFWRRIMQTANKDQAPLAMGGFATTLLSVSLAMMEFRGISLQTQFIGDLCFVACIGLLISAQWSMLKGDTFSYTVLTAFGKLEAIYPM
jgi:succinate-acetate transporter protein